MKLSVKLNFNYQISIPLREFRSTFTGTRIISPVYDHSVSGRPNAEDNGYAIAQKKKQKKNKHTKTKLRLNLFYEAL